jgi:hypothetical protein
MKSEKGQAIVFLALGFVVFLGFVGLAIDGGMLYSDRRHAQNGSDASSLAGGAAAGMVLANNAEDHLEITYEEWDCGSDWMNYAEEMAQNAAIARGGSNGFTIEDTLTQTITSTNNTYVTTACYDTWNGSYYDRYLDVTVNISDTTESSFAHLLYPAPLRNVVNATTSVWPKAPFGIGLAIIALNYECKGGDGGVTFEGNANMYIDGGGIFSNACFVGNGTATSVTVTDEDGDPIENVCTGEDCWDPNGKPQIIPVPIEGDNPNGIPPEAVYIAPPTCSSAVWPEVRVTNNQVETISPGTYQAISVLGGELYLEPGLYCIVGSKGVTITGGRVWGPDNYSPDEASLYSDTPFPTGVSFYLTTGGFGILGSPNVRLTAAMQGSCAGEDSNDDFFCPGISNQTATDLTAVLIYLGQENTSSVTLLGDSTSDFTGLVYAPAGTVNIGGTSNGLTSFNVQVIADTVVVHGSPEMTISYDDEIQRWSSAKIELTE